MPVFSLPHSLCLLCSAGLNINARDCSSGKTALMAIAQAPPMERCPEEQIEDELNQTDGASLFLRQPHAAHLTRELLKRGADPTVVDNGGSTPLMYAAHQGQAALVSLYLQWAAATQKDATLVSLATSPFVSRVNSFKSNALHYAFYCAHQTPSHVDCIRSLLSAGMSLDSPRNNLGRTPLQMFAAPNSDSGEDVCNLVLKQRVRRVMEQVHPPKKEIKFKLISADLSGGSEPFSIEVATELEPTASELASLKSFNYSMANSLSVRPHESALPMLNSDVTLCETVGRSHGGGGVSRSKRVQAKASFATEESDAEEEDDDPAELRRRLNAGMAFPLCIRLTAKKGWGVFAKKDIPRDALVFEYVGVLLSAAEGERRAQQYLIEGRHHYSFTAVLMNLVSEQPARWSAHSLVTACPDFSSSSFLCAFCGQDGDVYSLDATTQGNIARFCNHVSRCSHASVVAAPPASIASRRNTTAGMASSPTISPRQSRRRMSLTASAAAAAAIAFSTSARRSGSSDLQFAAGWLGLTPASRSLLCCVELRSERGRVSRPRSHSHRVLLPARHQERGRVVHRLQLRQFA